MTPAEIFALEGCTHSNHFADIARVYWEAEAFLAIESRASYSWLDDCTPYDRTCRLCGTVCHTDAFGHIPEACDNSRCQQIRKFWGVHRFPWCSHFNSGGPRPTYLRKRIEKAFGATKLSAIPDELKFDFLLSAMVERIAHESQH